MKPSLKQKCSNVLLWMLILICSLVCLSMIGIPNPRGEKVNPVKSHESSSHGTNSLSDKNSDLQGLQRKKTSPNLTAIAIKPVAPLTEEEERQLKMSNYNAYIRYRAQLEEPGRLAPATKEEIVRERLAPKLLEQLKRNKQNHQAG